MQEILLGAAEIARINYSQNYLSSLTEIELIHNK